MHLHSSALGCPPKLTCLFNTFYFFYINNGFSGIMLSQSETTTLLSQRPDFAASYSIIPTGKANANTAIWGQSYGCSEPWVRLLARFPSHYFEHNTVYKPL